MIPLLEELCLKNVFSILVENHKLTQHGIKQLPLPPMMISKMKRIFSAGESLVYAPNRTHEYGLRMPLETASYNEKILTLNDEEKLHTFPMSDCSEGKQKVVHLPL